MDLQQLWLLNKKTDPVGELTECISLLLFIHLQALYQNSQSVFPFSLEIVASSLTFTSIFTIQIPLFPTSHLPFFSSLSLSRGLGTLGRASPTGCVGSALSLIHPQRALWLNRLAQGHATELGEEGKAGSVELQADRAIYY